MSWGRIGRLRAAIVLSGEHGVKFEKILIAVSIRGGLDRRVHEGGDGNAEKLQGAKKMRVMVIVKASKESEAGVLPDEKMLTEMGKYNEELAKAGIMLAGEGLQASSKGKRIRFSGPKRTVIDGPFAETKELIAGFWLWQVKSMDEAVEWLKRCPNPHHEDTDVEIRQVFEAEDFGAELTPDLREQEERIRQKIESKR
jgi:hypothetical protein